MIDLHNTRNVLVIVPHEDDEINLMGGFLPLLVEKKFLLRFVLLLMVTMKFLLKYVFGKLLML